MLTLCLIWWAYRTIFHPYSPPECKQYYIQILKWFCTSEILIIQSGHHIHIIHYIHYRLHHPVKAGLYHHWTLPQNYHFYLNTLPQRINHNFEQKSDFTYNKSFLKKSHLGIPTISPRTSKLNVFNSVFYFRSILILHPPKDLSKVVHIRLTGLCVSQRQHQSTVPVWDLGQTLQPELQCSGKVGGKHN